MLKFSLTANENEREGFKFSFQADNKKDALIAQELAKSLISKITKIEIAIQKEAYQ